VLKLGDYSLDIAPASNSPKGPNDSILDLRCGAGVVKIKRALEDGSYFVLGGTTTQAGR